MFRLLYILEFKMKDKEFNIKDIVKLILSYILPTMITIFVFRNTNENINFTFKDTLINLSIINMFSLSIIHIYVQKKFFYKLEKDVIIKFIPNNANEYITLRILLIFIKSYFPVLMPSILVLKGYFTNLKVLVNLSSFLLIGVIIILNTLISVYWRMFVNTAKKIYVKIGNFIFFICICSLFVGVSFYLPISILNNLEKSLKNQIIRNELKYNVFIFLSILLISILICIMFQKTKCFLKEKFKLLIFNKNYSDSKNYMKFAHKAEKTYLPVYSFGLSFVERLILSKDIKEVVRESKYSYLFAGSFEMINTAIIVFFNVIDDMKTLDGTIIITKLTTGLVLFQIVLCTFIGKTGFEKHINMEEDFQIFTKYNINFSNKAMIKVKTRFLSAIVYPKVGLIFAILIILSVVQASNYLSIVYLLQMVQFIFFKEAVQIKQVKSINQLNSNKQTSKIFNDVFMLTWGSILIFAFYSVDKFNYILSQVMLIAIAVIIYVFEKVVNNDTLQGDDRYAGD